MSGNKLYINSFLLISIVLLFAFIPQSGIAQKKSKSQLEKEKKANLAKIEEAEKILSETESEKKVTLGQLKAVNRQIQARTALIRSINAEIRLLDGEIGERTIIVDALEADLKRLKEEYANMVYGAYKASHGFDRLTFLFSAKTFNQLFLRLKYLEQYTAAREIQVTQIEKVRDVLNSERSNLVTKKEEQNELLKSKIKENQSLLALKKKQGSIFQELSKKEKELRKEIADRKEAAYRLDKLIDSIVKAEIAAANKDKTTDVMKLSAEAAKLSASFEDNRNKLPWPVSSGFISERFGRHPHPVLKHIQVDNYGVDIQTHKNAKVQSVFEGKVSRIVVVPGSKNGVLVQHGDYFTLYVNLRTVDVKKGQVLKAGENIGEVYTNNDGISELKFQIWKNTVKMDPEKWLARK